MTKRTRLFLSIAAGVLVIGVGTGLVASYMGMSGLSILTGTDPDEFEYVPADARVVAFANVREIMTSDLREKFREMHPESRPDGSVEAQTGIDFDTDIDRVVAAILSDPEQGQRPLILARGRFDEVRIEGLIREKGGHVEDYKGKRLILTPEDNQETALTFAEPGLAVFGPAAAVRLAIDTKSGTRNVSDNAELMALTRDFGDSNAWAVGRFDAVSGGGRLPQGVIDQLPPINLFAVTGHINGGIRALVRAETRDVPAAQNLRDVIRGFLALGRLQAGSNPSLAAVINSVEIAGEGNAVTLSFTIPATALDLLPSRGAGPRPTSAAF